MDLKKKLKHYNYTLSDVAAALGISQPAISQQVRTGTLSMRRLQDIAAVVGCTAADLLADDEGGPGATTPGPDNFAALISLGGRNYTPATVDELRQLADRLVADRAAAGTDAAPTAPTDPPRRRRVPGATSTD